VNLNNNKKIFSTKKIKEVYGLTTGNVGTSPYVKDSFILCGFGDRLICFEDDGKIKWQFLYPKIELIDDNEPLTIESTDGEVIYSTTSEVNIQSNLHCVDNYLYFVLSECTRHISYLTKLDINTGKSVWTCKIEGYSHGFKVVDVLTNGILLQNGTKIWVIADGNIRDELELDIECAACSHLVHLEESKYLTLADFGVYEVTINMNDRENHPVVEGLFNKDELVFISAKSEDFTYAQEIYDFLIAHGVYTFFSQESLPKLGNSDYRREIDKNLDKAQHMIVVASSVENALSPWVEAEWGFFINEKRSGRKTGNLLIVTIGQLKPSDLPPSLRYYEVIPFEPQNINKILYYVS
jgi:hypothetical protein